MYYRIVKEHSELHNEIIYTVEYSKDRFYGWKVMFSNLSGSAYSYNELINSIEHYRKEPRYVEQLHTNNHKTHKREIVKYFKD